MDFIGLRKKLDSNIVDPLVRNQARRFSERTQLAFLPDRVVGRSWFFRLLTLVYYYFFVYFHGFEVVGAENLDRNRGYLLIARHSTHNGEILGTIVCFYHMTGRVIRSLIHKYLTPFFPVLRLMGAVPGERESAFALLKSKFWVVVVPGGADEGMIGHENAYKVCWPEKRKGFAKIAMEANVPIVPIFLANVEEMRWNPILFFWHFSLFLLIASTAWFLVTFIQLPIPAKITLYIGKPIHYDASKESVQDVVERSRQALQQLIDRHQPYGKSYIHALRQRIDLLTNPINQAMQKKHRPYY